MKDRSDAKRSAGFQILATFLIDDRQTIEGLEEEERHLATLGCLLAVDPASPEVRAVFANVLRGGMSPERLEAMLIHAIGYLGVIVLRNAHRQLLAELEKAGLHITLSGHAPIAENRQERVDDGIHLYDRFNPGRQAQQAQKFAALSPGYYPRAMELSGLVLGSPLLSLHDRQIMTVAMLACLGGQSDQLLFHMGVALRNGVSQTAMSGILLLVQAYAGMPQANSAASLALDALAQDQQASLL